MEIFLVCIVIGWLGFRLIKANTIRGLETVRAYAYLEAAKNGQSQEACAEISDYDFMNGPTELIIEAKHVVQTAYGGKQLLMIKEAYRQGMKSRLPTWQRMTMGF